MLLILVLTPLLLSGAIIVWFLFHLTSIWKALLRIAQRQERLSRVFWLFGIVGYPIFCLALGGIILTGGDIYLGHALFYDTGGPDHTTQSVIFWCFRTLYILGWSIGIILCRKNTGEKIYAFSVIVLVCTITFIILLQFLEVAKMPSMSEAGFECREMPEVQEDLRQQRIAFEAQNKQLQDSPLNIPAHYEGILKLQETAIVNNCAYTKRNKVVRGLMWP